MDKVQRLVDDHKVLVGFNNYSFDNPIIENSVNQICTDYKIVFDCLKVLYDYTRKRPNREVIIEWKGKTLAEQLPNRKLKTIAQVLDFLVQKGDIDYKIFMQNSWTAAEYEQIEKYLFLDVEITRKLFEFYVSYFDNFREYVNEDSVRRFDYIRSSTGSFAYSAICNLVGLPVEYEEDPNKRKIKPKNDGGFVLNPQTEYAEGTIVYLDFSSLYPFIYFQCNLFTHGDIGDWHGDGFFDVKGYYKTDKLGKIETILKDIYYKRAAYKKDGDSRQLPLKIMMNSLYGISGSAIFKNVFDIYTPGDCTSIGRKCLSYARQQLELAGFPVLYADTDSCFTLLPSGTTVDDAKSVARNIVTNLQSHMPFPDTAFTFKVDDIFKKIWFFSKKHYVGINQDGELVVKGLSVIKTDASQLGQMIYNKLKPIMFERGTIKFTKESIKQMIDEEIRKDITLVGQVYNVKNAESYKVKSGLHAQIASEFGEGLHLLIPNKSLGPIGKSKKYLPAEEADKLSVDDLLLDKVWNELSPFIADYMSDKDIEKMEMKEYKRSKKEKDDYFNSDLFDSAAVGSDITNEEFMENEIHYIRNC
jgi:DNA polymerase elongation subunit (family B)